MMTDSEHVIIQEAVRCCSVNPKNAQRAIRAGTLPAQYPRPNRCVIAASDLATFVPGRVQTATQQRLAEQVSGHVQVKIEQRIGASGERIQQLEHLVAALLDRLAIPKQQSRAKACNKRTTGPLQKRFTSLLAFARDYNVTASTINTHVGMWLLPAKRGEWTNIDGTAITRALDAEGKATFFQMA